MSTFRLLALLAIIATTYACKTTQPVRPMEKYVQQEIEERQSTLNIPLKINIKELEASVNQQLPDPLYNDDTMDDGDNLMIVARKKEPITLGIDSQMVTYRVPLILDIKYNIGITNVNATGEIALNFKTGFQIKENWELETSTILEDYQWLRTPRVKLAGVSLPVGFIGNIIINRSREILTYSIDEQVRTNFNFKDIIEETWKNMFDPMQVSEEYNAWLSINPLDIGMTQIETDKDTLISTIIVQSQPKISLGAKPDATNWRPLPLFQYRDFQSEDFTLYLNTEVSYQEAERIAKEQIVGESYSSGNRSVVVEDIELYGQDGKLVVNTKLSGSYDGSIYLKGEPVFNKNKNTIDIRKLDFTLDTKNFLVRSAGWLLKSTIKKQIQENLNFLLDYNMTEMENQIQSQLSEYPLNDGVKLNGQLGELNISDAYLTPNGIRVFLSINGKLGVYVSGFTTGE